MSRWNRFGFGNKKPLGKGKRLPCRLWPWLESLEERATPSHFGHFVDPSPSVDNGFGTHIVPLATGNVVITAPLDDAGGTNGGAVYLFNGATGALISTLRGSSLNDRIGGDGVTALTNGNFVVRSGGWDNGTVVNAGAVTWGSGTVGVNGLVSNGNSLIGSQANDSVGTAVIPLANGNYVVGSHVWKNGTADNAGAVTWGSGTVGIRGLVTSSNSLVGSRAYDEVGSEEVIPLTNGNYVVISPDWDNGTVSSAGAVTWGSGTVGVRGTISSANSLVGSHTDDEVGSSGVTKLTNGNFLVCSPYWGNGISSMVGAITWVNGTTGGTGVVSSANSLVGSQTDDLVGGVPSHPPFDEVDSSNVIALPNGNYVVISENWNNEAGAVTWGSGLMGVRGIVSSSNSLVGTTTYDGIGSRGVTALTNGNYVVNASSWNNGTVSNAGAVTWGSGTVGVRGIISSANSLVGSQTDDSVGSGYVTPLANGNYVVNSWYWNNGTVSSAGAVTWGSGTVGVRGTISSANSLVGSRANDHVGRSFALEGITPLSNGNYVVTSMQWANGTATKAGAVTWGSGMVGVRGTISTANSLVGTRANDLVGSGYVTPLANGNYVVASMEWANGTATKAGAATWGSGIVGVRGTISTANSLVGSRSNDLVGLGGITPLSNGNYVVTSREWANGTATKAGAATWGSGVSGVRGFISTANSLVGSQSNDQVGLSQLSVQGMGVTPLNNGNYVVSSGKWSNGPAANAGAVTWGKGTTGVKGWVSSSNSMVGLLANDRVGSTPLYALANGNYLAESRFVDFGSFVDSGAVTALNGGVPTSGSVSSNLSIPGIGSGNVDWVNGQFFSVVRSGAPGQEGGLVLAESITPSGLTVNAKPILTTTNGAANGVSVWGSGGVKLGSINPYPEFTGRIVTAQGDINGDGIADIITGRGAGASPLVKVYDGKTLQGLYSFNAYAVGFLGGITVELADTTGDGICEIITGTGNGSAPHVKVMTPSGAILASFYAYAPEFTRGVNLITGDINGDGQSELVTTANAGGGPHVKVFNGVGVTSASFFAYDSKYTGGVSLALGNVDGIPGLEILTMRGPATTLFPGVATARIFTPAGVLISERTPLAGLTQGGHILAGDLNYLAGAEIVILAGPGASPTVKVTNGTGMTLAQTDVYPSSFKGGVSMTLCDTNGDGIMEIATSPGAGFVGQVKRFSHALVLLDSFFALNDTFTGGVWLK